MPSVPPSRVMRLCLVAGFAIACLSCAEEACTKPADHDLEETQLDESSLSLIQKSVHAVKTHDPEENGQAEVKQLRAEFAELQGRVAFLEDEKLRLRQDPAVRASAGKVEHWVDPSVNYTVVKIERQQEARLQEVHTLTSTEGLYLDTVRDTLTGAILRTPSVSPGAGEAKNLQRIPFNKESRWADPGGVWCDECFTMVGGARLQNVRHLVEKTILEQVPGDFLEAGAWRGGSSIMARVVQRVYHVDSNRKTWVCDSFSGLPPASQKNDVSVWTGMKFLEVSQEEVKENFRSFQALDSNVEFRKGYFSESLPKLRLELTREGRQIAVLRGDGDMYESFLDILYNLYEFVPVGGYFICDDCPKIDVAQQAIDEFRSHHGITSPIQKVPDSQWTTFWRKDENTPVDYSWYLSWNATRIYKKKE